MMFYQVNESFESSGVSDGTSVLGSSVGLYGTSQDFAGAGVGGGSGNSGRPSSNTVKTGT